MTSTTKGLSVDNVSIAAPCPISWNDMQGDERVRFCSTCKLNVYNISEMTSSEAQSFLESQTGRLCLRLYRRSDGTLVTKDCKFGRKVSQGLKKIVRGTAAIVFTIVNATMALGQEDGTAKPLLKLPEEIGKVEKPRDINGMPISPTVLDIKHYTSNRSERHKKTAPEQSTDGHSGTVNSKTAELQLHSKADTTVIDLYTQARAYTADNDLTMAAKHYESATVKLRADRDKHDPIFVASVILGYASVLSRLDRQDEARELQQEFNVFAGSDAPIPNYK